MVVVVECYVFEVDFVLVDLDCWCVGVIVDVEWLVFECDEFFYVVY